MSWIAHELTSSMSWVEQKLINAFEKMKAPDSQGRSQTAKDVCEVLEVNGPKQVVGRDLLTFGGILKLLSFATIRSGRLGGARWVASSHSQGFLLKHRYWARYQGIGRVDRQ